MSPTGFFLPWQHASVGAVLLELSSRHSDHYRSCWKNDKPIKSNNYVLTFTFLEGRSQKARS